MTAWARRKGKLQLEATDRLRSMIVAGELRPGEPLREVRLSERLGVSRTPIREALRTLAAEGLVDLLPNRSAVVAKLHSPDIGQLFRRGGGARGARGRTRLRAMSPRRRSRRSLISIAKW